MTANQIKCLEKFRVKDLENPAILKFITNVFEKEDWSKNFDFLSEIDASMLSSDKPVSVRLDQQVFSNVDISADSKIILLKENNKWLELIQMSKLNNFQN